MKQILEFIYATATWLVMGMTVVIFAVRSAIKKKKGKKLQCDYGTEGMCLGMCFGTALGIAMGNNVGIGISLGMFIGLAVGMCIHKKSEKMYK